MTPSRTITKSRPLEKSMNGISRRRKPAVVATGQTIAVSPRMRPMLAMLEPTTLPNARSDEPRSAAARVPASSGLEVPKETTVSPITTGVMPSRRARATEPRTSASPPA